VDVVLICLAQGGKNIIMIMTLFWDVEPYSLVKVYRRCKKLTASAHSGDSGTPVNFYQTAWRNIAFILVTV
jgi:hypothetical protein